MIPLEIVTMLGGAVTGAALKVIGAHMEHKKLQTKLLLQRFGAEQESRETALEGPKRGWRGFQWTRRVIALTTVFSVIVLPKLAALLPLAYAPLIVYGYTETTHTFLWFGEQQRVTWEIINGIPITPVDIHTCMAIVGLYFGGSLVGHKS